jgi:hypothetical protein
MFTRPLTDRDLYWIGYIRADGHLMAPKKDTHSGRLCFSQKHEEPVVALHKYVKATNPVRTMKYMGDLSRPGSHGYDFSTRQAYPQLKNLGVKDILLAPDITSSLHFWRGMVDGDGCVCLPKTIRGRSVSIFLCLTKEDASCFLEFTQRLGLMGSRIYEFYGICKVQFGGEPAACLIKYLYEGHYSALDYKRALADEGMKYRAKRTRNIKPEAREFLYRDD